MGTPDTSPGQGRCARVFVNLPPQLYRELFSPESDAALRSLADVIFRDDDRKLTSSELAALMPGYDAVITGWGTPTFTNEVLDAADRLRIIAHSAGSVRAMVPFEVLDRGISVTHAAVALAPAVAEMAMLLVMLGLRHVQRYDRALKSGSAWEGQKAFGPPFELRGQRVGVISASYVGRHFIALMRAMECDIWVYDPYLTDEQATTLGVTRVPLHDLMAQCPIVSIHAPSTPETHRMLGQAEFALMPDSALLINTARSWMTDEDALLAELRTGRIAAALDVFDTEPLPLDSPFRQLDNVILTPHVAGASVQARFRQGETIVAELMRFFSGEALAFEVTRERYAILA
jgi:phosphoglycerate dehydrogenase-like enzyme